MAVTSAFSSPVSMAENNPANPRRSLRSVSPTGYGGVDSSQFQNPYTSAGLPDPHAQQRPAATYAGGSIGLNGPPSFGSLGNVTGMFTRPSGPVRSGEEQAGRSGMMQNFLANGGGWRFDGGGSGGSNPYSFDNAFRDAMSNQNAVQSLVGQGRQNLLPVMQQAQGAYSNAQGLDPATLSALERSGAMANASALAGIQRDTQNALSAGGFSGSPAEAYINAQTRGLSLQGDLDRRAQLALRDAETRNANRQFAAQWLSQLLGLDVQSAMQGAETIGRLQTPFLTPDAAAAMGAGGGGGGGGMPQGEFSSQQNNNQGSSRYLEQLLMNRPQQSYVPPSTGNFVNRSRWW